MDKKQIHDAVDKLLTFNQPPAVVEHLTLSFNKLLGCNFMTQAELDVIEAIPSHMPFEQCHYFMTQAELDVIEARLKIALEYLETKGGNDAN